MNEERKERIQSLKNIQVEMEKKLDFLSKNEETKKETLKEIYESIENLKIKIKRLEEKAIRGQILT